MQLPDRLQTALDELRMQMLGTEVLFGFQLEGTFKEGFSHLSRSARIVDAVALTGVVLALAAMISAPAQHRLVERGDASLRLLHATRRLASYALILLAVVLGCDIFVVGEFYLGDRLSIAASIIVFGIAISLWFVLGLYSKTNEAKDPPVVHGTISLHERIKQMLHESWIVLPGATGIFGFQLIITLSTAFEHVSESIQHLHFAALALVAVGVILLISPAAVHRLAFAGSDDSRSHTIGSRLITGAFAPLAIGISTDYYVAMGRLLDYGAITMMLSVMILVVLLTAWYANPWYLRTVRQRKRNADGPLQTLVQ